MIALELDHVFIATADPAVLEAALVRFGMSFSVRLVHRGQGTQNACALFDNAFLEILWPSEEAEIRAAGVAPLGLWERAHWTRTGACPFGVAFRPLDAGATSEDLALWRYEPSHRQGRGLPIVTPPGQWQEPLVFISPGSRAPELWPVTPRELQQWGRRRRLTAVTVQRPAGAPALSPGVRKLCEEGLLVVEEASGARLELEWDGGASGERYEFDPPLPLALRW